MSNLVVIAKYSFSHEANFAKMQLEASGIPAFISDEYTINMQWLYSDAMGGVRLFVSTSNAEKALEILNDETPIEFDFEEETESETDETKSIDTTQTNQVSTDLNPVIKLGYAAVKFICWILLFRTIYFSMYVFSSDGFFNAVITLLYFGWIPSSVLYFFYKYHNNGKGVFFKSIVKFVLPFLAKSILIISGFLFLIWCIKYLTN